MLKAAWRLLGASVSAARPQPSTRTNPSNKPIAWLHAAGPLFDMLELSKM